MSHALCSLSNVVLNSSLTASSPLAKGRILDARVALSPSDARLWATPGWGIGMPVAAEEDIEELLDMLQHRRRAGGRQMEEIDGIMISSLS